MQKVFPNRVGEYPLQTQQKVGKLAKAKKPDVKKLEKHEDWKFLEFEKLRGQLESRESKVFPGLQPKKSYPSFSIILLYLPHLPQANPKRTQSNRPTVLAITTTSMGAVRSSCILKHYTSYKSNEGRNRKSMPSTHPLSGNKQLSQGPSMFPRNDSAPNDKKAVPTRLKCWSLPA